MSPCVSAFCVCDCIGSACVSVRFESAPRVSIRVHLLSFFFGAVCVDVSVFESCSIGHGTRRMLLSYFVVQPVAVRCNNGTASFLVHGIWKQTCFIVSQRSGLKKKQGARIVPGLPLGSTKWVGPYDGDNVKKSRN